MTALESTAHRSLVALSPQDVSAAQAELAAWCKAKVLELSADLRDARQNFRQAKANKWKHLPWARVISKTAARMSYYTKIRQAVQAGYLIIPNFDVEVMAVRVNRETPPETTSTWERDGTITEAKAQLLPPGVGRYVDGVQFTRDESFTAPDPNNPAETKTIKRFRAVGYDDPDFPVLAVKPIILEATVQAMSLKLFDRIGVVTGRKNDPLVVGELLDPADRWRQKRVTFFIAWWLDTRAL